jgi:hypothetical protein
MKSRVDFDGGHDIPEKALPTASQRGRDQGSILYFIATVSTIITEQNQFHDDIPTAF